MPRRVLIARVLAVAVDLVQYALLPAALTPLNNVVDVLTGVAMLVLVGWHWAFLPSFLSELIPIWDLVPTWTAAVWYVTSGAPPPGEAPPGAPAVRVEPPHPPPALKG